MSGGLSKLGSALVAVFAVCLLLLAAELLYVLWRRRRFQRRSVASGDPVLAGGSSSSIYVLPSKELLYFFCWKNQSARIEPNDANVVIDINGRDQVDRQGEHHDHDQAAEIDDVMKTHQQGMCGPSRLLFTITEEEEADHDHDHEHHDRGSPFSSDGLDRLDVCDDDDDDDDQAQTVVSSTITDCSKDCDVAVVVLDDATPFSTPCGSPPYYTPSPSPSREELKQQSTVSVHESYGVSAVREGTVCQLTDYRCIISD